MLEQDVSNYSFPEPLIYIACHNTNILVAVIYEHKSIKYHRAPPAGHYTKYLSINY